MREHEREILADEVGKLAAEHATIAAVILPWNVRGSVKRVVGGVQWSALLVFVFIFEIPFEVIQATHIRTVHRVIVLEAFVSNVDDGKCPMKVANVDGNKYLVIGE